MVLGGDLQDVGLLVVAHTSEFLDDCLASVTSQTKPADAVVLIDNASPGEAVRQVAARHGVGVIRLDEPVALGAARNLACRDLDGCDLIASLDGDDVLRPAYLERYAAVALERRADVVFGTAELFGAHTGRAFDRSTFGARLDLRRRNRVPANSMFRRSLWETTGGFDPTIAHFEDWDLWLSFAELGARFEHVDEALWCYRRHAGSKQATSPLDARWASYGQIMAKHRRYVYGLGGWRRIGWRIDDQRPRRREDRRA